MCAFDVLFLGTCAADFSPRLKTDKKDCFDKDVRRSSSMLLNGHILVDCGPHTLDSMRIAGKALSSVTDIFLTHLHDDHFDPENVARVAAERGGDLRLWVREDAVLPELDGVRVMRMRLYEGYDAGDGIRVTAYEANHTECPQHLLFERDGKSIYYALDGAWILYETFLKIRRKYIDLIVMDCTMGDYDGDLRVYAHNSIPMVRSLLKSFYTVGIAGENSEIYMSHLAPSLHKSHEETVQICAQFGAKVAYDGLTLTV